MKGDEQKILNRFAIATGPAAARGGVSFCSLWKRAELPSRRSMKGVWWSAFAVCALSLHDAIYSAPENVGAVEAKVAAAARRSLG